VSNHIVLFDVDMYILRYRALNYILTCFKNAYILLPWICYSLSLTYKKKTTFFYYINLKEIPTHKGANSDKTKIQGNKL